jgi:hypothetical protein
MEHRRGIFVFDCQGCGVEVRQVGVSILEAGGFKWVPRNEDHLCLECDTRARLTPEQRAELTALAGGLERVESEPHPSLKV